MVWEQGMGAAESLGRAMGIGGWGVVALGFLFVALAVLLGGRRRCGKLSFPAETLGQEPEKIAHSAVYTPPPHRQNYRSNRHRR